MQSTVTDNFLTDISLWPGMEYERIIMRADLPLGVAVVVVANLDADMTGDNHMIITGTKNSISKLRAVSISEYSPYATRGKALKELTKMPKLSIVGLDIVATTIVKGTACRCRMTL